MTEIDLKVSSEDCVLIMHPSGTFDCFVPEGWLNCTDPPMHAFLTLVMATTLKDNFLTQKMILEYINVINRNKKK